MMENNKENLQKRIIPSLLYGKDGKKFIDKVKIGLQNRAITKNQIMEKFNNVSDYKSEEFWSFFLDFYNYCFGSDVGLRTDNEGFKNMIKELQIIRFEEIFKKEDSMRVLNKEKLISFLDDNYKSKEGTVDLSDSETYRIIVPRERKFSVNVEYYMPKELSEYPNDMIKVENDQLSIFTGKKPPRNKFFDKLDSYSEELEEPIVEEEAEGNLDNFDVDLTNFFRNLKEKRIYVGQAKFNNDLAYFNIGFKDTIDLQEVMDCDFFINSVLDFISFKEFKFIYSKSFKNGKTHDYEFKVEISNKSNHVKFNIHYYSDDKLDESIEREIESKFEELGLKFQAYELPPEYYINNLLQFEGSVDGNYGKIKEMEPENRLIKKLEERSAIFSEEGKMKMDQNKLREFINEVLKKLEGENINMDKDDYKLIKANIDDKNRQNLLIRITDNENNLTRNYNIIIYPDVRSYEKITSIIFPKLNYSSILNKIMNNKSYLALKEISRISKLYLKNKYNINLIKEANNSYDYLTNYVHKWQEIEQNEDPKKIGFKVEEHLNIILKYIYRNYLLIGGHSAPDGYMTIGNENYLIDSKQHRNIAQGEYDKVFRYVFGYARENGLSEAKKGVFVVCRGKIGDSLNLEARKEWEKSDAYDPEYKVSFLTIEYFLRIFEILKESRVQMSPKIDRQIIDSFKNLVNTSSTLNNSQDLIKREKTQIENIKHSVNEIAYTPDRENQI